MRTKKECFVLCTWLFNFETAYSCRDNHVGWGSLSVFEFFGSITYWINTKKTVDKTFLRTRNYEGAQSQWWEGSSYLFSIFMSLMPLEATFQGRPTMNDRTKKDRWVKSPLDLKKSTRLAAGMQEYSGNMVLITAGQTGTGWQLILMVSSCYSFISNYLQVFSFLCLLSAN